MLPTADSSFSVGHRELATRATHSGTWTAVNSPLSIAASRLQTETQNVCRRVLTHWLSYGPCTEVLGLLLTSHFPQLLPINKQKHKTFPEEWWHTEPQAMRWYLDCCQQTAHSPLPPPVYKQKHKKLTKLCWQHWATQSGTWTAVNILLSIAASCLQTVLTNWVTGHTQQYLDCRQHCHLPSTNRNTKP